MLILSAAFHILGLTHALGLLPISEITSPGKLLCGPHVAQFNTEITVKTTENIWHPLFMSQNLTSGSLYYTGTYIANSVCIHSCHCKQIDGKKNNWLRKCCTSVENNLQN